MQAMQYEITLPADYDMGIVHHRVATRGQWTDAFPGLGLKAYLVREIGTLGSPVNAYAPFYLWRTAAGMADFLTGRGFRGLSADFGRPAVRHWIGAGLHAGPAADTPPTTATRTTRSLPPGTDPGEETARALAALGDAPGLHTAAVALDPARWELVHFALWADTPPGTPAEGHCTAYRVLHLSRPELHLLAKD
ncbi:DUF4865 family protein [Kitasatospora sp. DSM 101779]|uniref:DUF4865 family protein n=1 Tax=Kitasatospora sp. DSM 101779 TaxID=2853165 RepID=UPI0021D90E17|nr:DUF4865 family protein [Kitasatospora sp. DSM 101779]MCU7821820.1 DUF4865 family protein [Kitasatospora sp. DSM 101779]